MSWVSGLLQRNCRLQPQFCTVSWQRHWWELLLL